MDKISLTRANPSYAVVVFRHVNPIVLPDPDISRRQLPGAYASLGQRLMQAYAAQLPQQLPRFKLGIVPTWLTHNWQQR